MLTIRLTPTGKKHQKQYRVIISEKKRDVYGKALEILGSYNPHTKLASVNQERIKHWIEKGAQMSPTINNLLVKQGLVRGEKLRSHSSKNVKAPEVTKEAIKESVAEEPAENKQAE